VTIGAVWANYELAARPGLWMASDSRISDGGGRLIDEGIKLYELPMVCSKPDEQGFFTVPFHATSFGMVCAGGSLVYQQVYGAMVPILTTLISDGTQIPTVAAVATLAGELTTRYVRSLGHRRRDAHRVELIVGGHTIGLAPPQAFALRARLDDDDMVAFSPEELPLEDGQVHFIGDHLAEASSLLSRFQARDEPGAPRQRAALNVIRVLIDDPSAETTGGEVQIGHAIAAAFRRVATIVPDRGNEPRALRLLNAIDVDDLPPVGPCAIGLGGMVSP
jgi:hypothetical protein